MAADGSIIIDTRINTQGFGKGAANLKGQFASLGTSLKKLGGMIAAAFSVKVLLDFGKQALQLGSDLQEVQNVVDVTFTTMNEQVNEFAQNAAKTAGLSETMAKQYTGTFGAMAKSFKFTEDQAYTMATSLAQLSGDVASFYNITQDAAYTKLKSVFTGETESLKDLGVVMTQTALDDYAMRKGLQKTTKQMSEQEKVALRYEFVLEQLAGASGDFLRTQDGWANQTRLLKLQFDQLKATIGQGLISAFTPLLRVINQVLAKLQVLTSAISKMAASLFKNKTEDKANAIAGGYNAAAAASAELVENTEAAGKAAEGFLAGFDEIEKIGSSESATNTTTADGFSFVPTDLTVNVSAEGVEDTITSQVEQIVQSIADLLQPLKRIDFSPLMGSLVELGNSFKNFGIGLANSLGWVWSDFLVPLAEWAIEEAAPTSLELLSSAFDFLGAVLSPVISGIEKLWDKLTPVVEWIKDFAIDVINKLGEQFDKVANVFTERGPDIEKIFEGIGEIVAVVWEAIKPIMENMKAQWQNTIDFLGDVLANAVDAIITMLGGLIDFIAGAFTGDWERAFGGLETFVKAWINGVVGFINKLLNAVAEGLNFVIRSLNKLSFNVPEWVPLIGGETWGFNMPLVTAPQLPYLATGAVIPPNAPFAAILGDQRSGNNIEAPEDLIRKIVREEAGGMNDALLREILQAIREGKVLMVDRKRLGEVVAQSVNDTTRATGNSPIAVW